MFQTTNQQLFIIFFHIQKLALGYPMVSSTKQTQMLHGAGMVDSISTYIHPKIAKAWRQTIAEQLVYDVYGIYHAGSI